MSSSAALSTARTSTNIPVFTFTKLHAQEGHRTGGVNRCNDRCLLRIFRLIRSRNPFTNMRRHVRLNVGLHSVFRTTSQSSAQALKLFSISTSGRHQKSGIVSFVVKQALRNITLKHRIQTKPSPWLWARALKRVLFRMEMTAICDKARCYELRCSS